MPVSVFPKLIASIALSLSLMNSGANISVPEADLQGYLYLANHSSLVPASYEPEVVRPNVEGYSSKLLRKEAADALETMFKAAKKDGIKLVAISGYRPYSKQEIIYERKIKRSGVEQQLVAVPGTSEHQLGLAMDVATPTYMNLSAGFAKTKAGKWVEKHCHEYGFIIRYPKSHESVTMIKYEPWHLRYVGKEHSQRVHDMDNLPFEYYLSKNRLSIYKELLDFED